MANITTLAELEAAEPAPNPSYVYDPNFFIDPSFFHGGGGGGGGGGWTTVTLTPIENLLLQMEYDNFGNQKVTSKDNLGNVLQVAKFAVQTNPDGTTTLSFASAGKYGSVGPFSFSAPAPPPNQNNDWDFQANGASVTSKGGANLGNGFASTPEPDGATQCVTAWKSDYSGFTSTVIMPSGDQVTLPFTMPSGGAQPNALLDIILMILGLMLAAFGCMVMFEFLLVGIILWAIGGFFAVWGAYHAK